MLCQEYLLYVGLGSLDATIKHLNCPIEALNIHDHSLMQWPLPKVVTIFRCVRCCYGQSLHCLQVAKVFKVRVLDPNVALVVLVILSICVVVLGRDIDEGGIILIGHDLLSAVPNHAPTETHMLEIRVLNRDLGSSIFAVVDIEFLRIIYIQICVVITFYKRILYTPRVDVVILNLDQRIVVVHEVTERAIHNVQGRYVRSIGAQLIKSIQIE